MSGNTCFFFLKWHHFQESLTWNSFAKGTRFFFFFFFAKMTFWNMNVTLKNTLGIVFVFCFLKNFDFTKIQHFRNKVLYNINYKIILPLGTPWFMYWTQVLRYAVVTLKVYWLPLVSYVIRKRLTDFWKFFNHNIFTNYRRRMGLLIMC